MIVRANGEHFVSPMRRFMRVQKKKHCYDLSVLIGLPSVSYGVSRNTVTIDSLLRRTMEACPLMWHHDGISTGWKFVGSRLHGCSQGAVRRRARSRGAWESAARA